MSRQARSFGPLRDPAVWTALAALAAAVAVAPLAASSPTLAVVGVGGLTLAGAVALHPPFAAFVLIAATPLIVGIDRGSVIPILRPNEALALVLATGLSARLAAEIIAGKPFRPRFSRVDVAILALAVTASVFPLLWMHARGADITQDDILYGLTLWKYYGLYLIVRASVRSVRDVEICLWLSLGAAAIVAVVAILQALQVFGVADLLARHYAPLGREQALDDMRGTSTIAAPQAVADVMTFNLAIAAGLVLRGSPRRTGLIALSRPPRLRRARVGPIFWSARPDRRRVRVRLRDPPAHHHGARVRAGRDPRSGRPAAGGRAADCRLRHCGRDPT